MPGLQHPSGRRFRRDARARRDDSLCAFAESPGRCRALLSNDPEPCSGPDGADDCALAVGYWDGLIPAGTSSPLIDRAALADKPFHATFILRWPKREHPNVRIQAPPQATGLSWPSGGKNPPMPGRESDAFWGFPQTSNAAQITWRAGTPAINLAFIPSGAAQGTRVLQASGPLAPATFAVVWADQPREFLRCQSGLGTRGQVEYSAGGMQPGALVEGQVKAQRLTCSDGSEMELEGSFRAVILDRR